MRFPFGPRLDHDWRSSTDADLNPTCSVGTALRAVQIFEADDDTFDPSIHAANRGGEPSGDERLKTDPQDILAVNGNAASEIVFGGLRLGRLL